MKPHEGDRALLLDTGSRLLAGGHSTSALTADLVVRLAKLPLTAFQASFADLQTYKAALLKKLLDEVLDEATVASRDMPAGIPRMCRATEAYLDATLRRPALRELMFTLHGHSGADDINRSRIEGFVMIFRIEFEAAGAPRPVQAARIATALVVEAATAEFETRRPLPEFRETLYAYFRRYAA